MSNYIQNHKTITIWLLIVISPLLWQGCAGFEPMPEETPQTVYVMGKDGDETVADRTVRRWAPAFAAYKQEEDHNRIGRPVARRTGGGNEAIDIDTDQPAVFVMQREFVTEKARYRNLIYRVHFPAVPYSLIPFHLTAGSNVGLMVVVTLNQRGEPLLVTTVHTCGCYMAIVPTDFLPAAALPEGWQGVPLDVYGETLTSELHYSGKADPRLLVHLRPEVHRVMKLEVVLADRLGSHRYAAVPMSPLPVESLLALPYGRETTSFYYEEGFLKGHVKGSVKPFETLLMSLISLDLFVGSDKIYADPENYGNRFYTSLKPWRRSDSNMWDFAGFLKYWGWRL
jgi:hypothetical protein